MKTVIVWLVVVFALSVLPLEASSKVQHSDKILHFIIYAITCVLLFTVIAKKKPFWTALAASFALSAGYGLLMEGLQGLTATRSFSLLDEAANTLGALSATAFIILRRKRG
ncbi:MAG: VanZ family protein [Thermodesulfovibrionales bacterium]|nr:VanZ family protein [Thermodesulfovibrionales bacterium]